MTLLYFHCSTLSAERRAFYLRCGLLATADAEVPAAAPCPDALLIRASLSHGGGGGDCRCPINSLVKIRSIL